MLGNLKFFSSFFDLIAPRTCCVCGRRLDVNEEVICTVCFLHLPLTNFLDNPYDNDMAKVFFGRIRHLEKAFALLYHVPHANSARPIYRLKYNNQPDLGTSMGYIMGKKMKESGFFDDIDAILPIPLAKKRLKERGYNQSEMIALGMHDAVGLPIIKKAVKRLSFRGSQTQKDRWDRAENVENAFEITNPDKIKGRHVLIVDDVVTTGATVCALAKLIESIEGVKISVAAISFAGQRTLTKPKRPTSAPLP